MGKTSTPDSVKRLHYLAAALRAPRISDNAMRLANRARNAGWNHDAYLAAVLRREVAARQAPGASLRVKGAGFPAVRTFDEFDWDPQPTTPHSITAITSGAYLHEARNVVLLGPPGTG